MTDLNALADSVVLIVKTALAPIQAQMAAFEARLAPLIDLRDRVVTVEAKGFSPPTDHALIASLQERIVTLEVKAIADVATLTAAFATRIQALEAKEAVLPTTDKTLAELRDRVVVVETKALTPPPEPQDLTSILDRLAVAEVRLSQWPATDKALTELRDRVVVVETKAAQPEPAIVSPPDLAPILERLAAAEARVAVLGDLRDRVVTIEAKAVALTPAPILQAMDAPPPVDLAPVLERVAAAEARLSTLGDLRDRVVTVEAKSSIPMPPPDLSDVRDRLVLVEARMPTKELWDELSTARLQSLEWQTKRDDSVTKELAALRERVAVVEVRPPVPGPRGEPGLPGQDGKDGTAGLSFEGVYQEGQTYEKGNLVTWAGSSWHCNETTTTKPGEGLKAWTLMVKRGRDGKDGRDAQTVPVVSIGGSR